VVKINDRVVAEKKGNRWVVSKEHEHRTYTIQNTIGEGSGGYVYAATDGNGKQVAIKHLVPDFGRDDGNCLRRAGGTGAKLEHLASMQHEGADKESIEQEKTYIQNERFLGDKSGWGDTVSRIIPKAMCDALFLKELVYSAIFDALGVSASVYGFDTDRYYIVMEHLQPLKKNNRKLEPFTNIEWKRIFEIEKIVNAEMVSHQDRGNLSNYMLGDDGKIYLIDWGMARAITDKTAYLKNPMPSAFRHVMPPHMQQSAFRRITWEKAATVLS
jgi:serine/threonine protein kinase